MRAGRIGRVVVRAIIVGLMALGGWLAATMVAHAEHDWQINTPDSPSVEQPVVRPR